MSETIHFEAVFKEGRHGQTGKVPHCRRWALSAKHGSKLTTDKALVNCSRCAKDLDIVPAAKAPSKNPTLTCQCCFGAYKTKVNVALHGYERPGHGYITGRCRGEGHLPFEESCEQTKVYRTELIAFLTLREQYLMRIQNNEVEFTYAEVDTGNWVMGRSEKKLVKVVRGDEEKENPFLANHYRIPSFKKLMEYEEASNKQTIGQVQRQIQFLDHKILNWVKTR